MKKTFSNLKWLPIFALILGVIAVSCKDDEVVEPVYSMTTDVTSISLDMNDGDVVTATITPETIKDGEAFTENYKFTSNDPLVASVSSAGVVTALGGGNTTVVVEGTTSGKKVTVTVEVIAALPAPTFTELRLINGSIEYTWEADRMTVTAVDLFDEAGETPLVGGDLDADKKTIDYYFLPDFANGSFILKPTGSSNNFKAGVTVTVKITVEGADEAVIKTPTVHDAFAITERTLSTISFDWDIECVNSGIVPDGMNVYYRNPGVDGGYYTRGDVVGDAEISAIVADTAITVSNLESNVSYWFDLVDANGNVLDSTNTTMPSPISQIKAGNEESIWYGDANSAKNNLAECRRISDRIMLDQNLVTYDQIQTVEVKSAGGEVLASLGEWDESLANYEYAWAVDATVPVQADFDAATQHEALYMHEKIDPDDGKNGEFKYIAFFDLPYSVDAYTVVLTTKDGKSYEKTFNTKAKMNLRNRAVIQNKYADATAANDANLEFLVYSNVAGDNGSVEFSVSDPNVASVNDQGVISFIANGVSVVYAVAPSGAKYDSGVFAATSYADNYWQFNGTGQGVSVGTSKDISFKSQGGQTFVSAVSSDEGVATVGGDNGLTITGVAVGSAVITITDNEGNVTLMTVNVK